MDIQIKCVETVDRGEMKALYEDAGWWDQPQGADTAYLDQVVTGSALFAAAFHGGKMIGMGRALSDSVSDAYIQDIVVLKTYHGQGIGRKIIETLISGLKEKGVDWIGLMAVPGTRHFYEELGFRELKGYIPFKLEDSSNNSL